MNNELKEFLRSVIREELSPLNERLERLETEQKTIKQAVLETNESVKRLEAIQEQQQHIIELLSVRETY